MDIQYLRGVGPKRAETLRTAGIATVADFLQVLPLRYEDRRHVAPIGALREGESVTCMGRVTLATFRRMRGRMCVLKAVVADDSGVISCVFFNQPWLEQHFRAGRRIVLFGAPRVGRDGLHFNAPSFQFLEDDEAAPQAGIVPVYGKLANLTPGFQRKLVETAVDVAESDPSVLGADPLPAAIREALGLAPLRDALRNAHFPDELPPAGRRRLVFDELFLMQMGLLTLRRTPASPAPIPAPVLAADDELRALVRRILPFPLTGAQKRVLKDIASDLRSGKAMNRLLQGDVGSGKTIVAALAMLLAHACGKQSAIMAPTEILAEQHALTLRKLLQGTGVEVGLLTAGLSAGERRLTKSGLRHGRIAIGVGTHALFQEEVLFKDLALAVVDEQHRFGVLQRAALRRKGVAPHLLVMSATPIPRSLAMTLYGDLDLSVLDEMPPGRTPIATRVVAEKDRAAAYRRVRAEVESGRQAYVVAPLVEESEASDLRAAEALRTELATGPLLGLSLGLLHGRMKAEQKADVMDRFRRGLIQVLVATTVVEVGVDVPNATVMLVEHADRFGLSQLHQLRGRVGRGAHASTCLLLKSRGVSNDGFARLKVMEETTDGFVLAEKDLEIRGPGDLLGTRQAGVPALRLASLVRDRDVLLLARDWAHKVLAGDVPMTQPEKRTLWAAIQSAWRGTGALLSSG